MQDATPRLWTKSFITLTCCSFLLFLNLQMLLSSFPAYVKNQFQADDITVSLVTSLFAISAIISRFLTAELLKRIPRSFLLFVGLIIAGVITGVYVLAGTIQSLLTLRVIYGLGFGISSTIIPTMVSQIIPRTRMGEGIGYFGLSTSLAMSIGPMIGLNVMNHAGFGTLSILGMVAAIAIIPIMFVTRSTPPDPRHQSAKLGMTLHPKQPFNKKLIAPAILNTLLSVTYSGVLSFIALFGQELHIEQVGLFFLFNAVTIILIRPISGRLFDSKGHGAVLIPAALFVIASMVILSITTNVQMLIVSALLYGLGFGAIQPTIQAWMLRLVPQAQHSMANSMFYNSTDLGVAGGAILLGAISTATNYPTMYRYSAGFMLLFLIVYLIGMFLKKDSNKTASREQAS
ncbi:MFS transporter [Paenibacillus sp. 1001270B_150601_E10]|uniref:MFS transporter n=1 Tax=Paenibacillus sp. 1001270B_150601_E10 TaxID=2787079 RepID=UPI00189CD801|nr:MFS transporter [Paenibacillus sp. 1001270B_150601_E10]